MKATVTLTYQLEVNEIPDDMLEDCADGANIVQFRDSFHELLFSLAQDEDPTNIQYFVPAGLTTQLYARLTAPSNPED